MTFEEIERIEFGLDNQQIEARRKERDRLSSELINCPLCGFKPKINLGMELCSCSTPTCRLAEKWVEFEVWQN